MARLSDVAEGEIGLCWLAFEEIEPCEYLLPCSYASQVAGCLEDLAVILQATTVLRSHH